LINPINGIDPDSLGNIFMAFEWLNKHLNRQTVP